MVAPVDGTADQARETGERRRGGRGDSGRRMFLTADEVGHELGLGRSRVHELAAAGHLPVVRLGRQLWFPRRGLDALADDAVRSAREALERTL
jgi:excisionase family DNA binding protein